MYVCPTKVLKRDTTELMKALKRVPTEFTVFEDQGLRILHFVLRRVRAGRELGYAVWDLGLMGYYQDY